MSMPPDFDWLEDKPRRGRGCGCLLAALLFVGVGTAGLNWAATASPWSQEIQSRWAATPVGRQVEEIQLRLAQSPVAQWWGNLRALTGGGDRLARLAPADTRVYAEFSPSWWNRLWLKGGALQPGEESRASVDEARQALREQWGIDWDEDVAPWIRPEGGMFGGEDQWSFWAGSDDDGRAAAFIAKVRAHLVARGAIARDQRHGGTDYVTIIPAEGDPYAVARLAGYVVAATPPGAMPRLIDQVERPGPSLANDNPRYRRVASAWDRGALGHAFFDMAGASDRPEQLKGADALGAALSAGSDWAKIDMVTAFQLPEGAHRIEPRAILPRLDMARFDRLPSATVVAVGGTATPEMTAALAAPLAAGWAPLGGESGAGWVFSVLLGSMRSLEGPFALGLVASDPEAQDPVGAVLSIQPADPQAAARELEKSVSSLTTLKVPAGLPEPLARVAALPWVKGLMPQAIGVSEERHRGEPWKILRAGGQDLAAWTVSEHELVIAGGGEAVKLSQRADFEALDRKPSFQAARRHLKGDVGAYVYADGQNLAQLLEASPLLPAKYAASARRGLEPLRAIAAMAEPEIDAEGFHRAALTVLVTP